MTFVIVCSLRFHVYGNVFPMAGTGHPFESTVSVFQSKIIHF